MKNYLILFLFLCFISSFCFAQESDSYIFELDDLVSLEMPVDEVFELDTIIQDRRVYTLYHNIENTTLLAQKSGAEGISVDENLSNLPYDEKTLEEYYGGFVKGMTNNELFKNPSHEKIEMEGYIARKVVFRDSIGNLTYEGRMVLLNKSVYIIGYLNHTDFNIDDKDKYLQAIVINHEQKISQFDGKSKAFKTGYLLGKSGIFIFIAIGGIVLVIVLVRNNRTT